MGAIKRLILHGWIPPTVEQENVTGELKIQPDAPRPVAHQQHTRRRIISKLLDYAIAAAGWDAAVVLERIEASQRRTELVDRVHPLAEDDGLAAARGALLEVRLEAIEFGAGA